MSGWIDISEYAAKYGVSASTLRRRIRAKSIEFRMEKGRYLMKDSAETIERAPLYVRRHDDASPTAIAPQEFQSVLHENRKLKEQISELETLVKALEAELSSN